MAENLDNASECFSEYCDSDSCGSSCCSGSDDELQYFPWLEKVGSRGELFYIEPSFSFHADHETYPINSDPNSSYQTPVNQTKSKLNPAEKFKKWMKKRKRKVRKSFPLLKQSKFNDEINDNVFLDPLLSLPSRDVYIEVDSTKQTLGRRVSLCEELLGLELGLFEDMSNCSMENKIKILGFVPGHDIPDIKPGDWLISINDITLDLHNLDEVLRGLTLPAKVKLTVSTSYSKTASKSGSIPDHDSILEELLGNSDVINESKSQLLCVPHGIFYLVIEDESVTNEGVVYKFPNEDTPLFQLKGMFITLSHMISDIASPPLLSCSLSIQGELVHVSFVKEGNGTFVLALPGRCFTISESQHFVTNLVKLLKFQFSSVKIAFAIGNQNSQLDNFFTIFFKHYLSKYSRKKRMFDSHLLEILPSVHWLPLPIDLKTEVDDILSELESTDFGSLSDGFDGNQRIYSILGSCLFYKGYLLSNHLPKNDLLDIHLFLHYHHLLYLTKKQAVSEIIIWHEIFPSRRQEPSTPDPDFIEVQGRWFLLIVAMNHCILSVILEAGGCTLLAEGHPPPEPFYVEEVQNTLIILHDCGITSGIEKILHQCLPPLAPPHLFMKEHSSVRNLFSSIFSNASSSSSLNSSSKNIGSTCNQSITGLEKDRSDDFEAERQQLLFAMGPADGESDVDSSYSDVSNENLYTRQSSRSYSFSTGSTTESAGSGEFSNQQGQSFKRTTSNNSDMNNLHIGYENCLLESTSHVVAGYKNTLFQYLHMDPVEGVFLAPIPDVTVLRESALKDIWDNFYRCCLNLRTVFARSLRNEEIIKLSTATKYGVNTFLRNAYEQGVLFRYTPKDNVKQKISMTFWVVGRLFFSPEPRELYVCYHDSSHQDIVEIAFRLGFGLSL
ncbi:protein inturned [Trichonephila inaurata madagascariensis]|uniref:Protein inturned n=1 Tax=Trichonephila inaurata madagascariensis TaxID=2747483 RepID=A0A8X6MD48_9ARAC|nr:protein inturned [Trichonephila inaurata madagascariensis]